MHGGATGSGAPKDNQNALKHGTFSRAAHREREHMRTLMYEAMDLLQNLNAGNRE
jgi:hypothetical protein